jgi:tetratricopeptide (TPR) repeat protein
VGPPPEEPLRVLEKYEVIRRIAQGGMGEIFLSRQVGVAGFNRLVILKTLLPELAEDEAIRSSFLNEARIGAQLNHPNIVAIYEIGEWEGVYFLAMEYVNGGGLDGIQRAAYKKKVGIPRAVSAMLVRDAARGLDHAHAAKDPNGDALNIVHRDCTPQNIMVRLDGVVKVVDFGIAKAAGSDNRTNAGEVKGKLAYLAPEQIKGEELDGRCDQFALGVVFWELVTGRRLFNAPNPIDIFKKILSHDIPRPRDLDPGVPEAVDNIVMRMLAHDRDARYPRLGDAAREINTWVESISGTTDQVSLFVREMIGAETSGRTQDLTPTPVKIQGLVPQARTMCHSCGAKNTAKARFCAECGQPIESTGEASRKMIAAATGQAPFLRPDSGNIPASVEGLLDGPPPVPNGMTPVPSTALSNELMALTNDARVTMGDIFGEERDSPASGAYPIAPRQPPPGTNPFAAQMGATAFPAAPSGSGAFPAAPASSSSYPVSPSAPSTDIGMSRADRSESSEGELWVGRRDVLMEVGRLVREVASGTIKALVLAGDHGSGRTASLEKAAKLAAAARLRVVRVQGRHHGPRQPLDLMRQIFAAVAGCGEHDTAALLKHFAERQLPPARLNRLEMAFGGQNDPQVLLPELVHLAHQQDFVKALAEEARHEGLCLLIDDLHWADAASRRILDALVNSRASVPIALLATGSLRFDTAQLPRHELGPLLDAEIQQLLDAKLGMGGLPPNARAAVVGKARGNPGFALDLVEVLRFEGAIQNLSGSWVTTDTFEAQKLPPNPTFFIMNRLRSLSASAQTALKVAAAVGVQFDTTYVASASRKSGDIEDAIAECVAAQIIMQVDHGRYRFTRSIYADVALRMCEGAEEREIHQRLYKAMAAMTDDINIALDAAGHLLQGDASTLLAEAEFGASVARELDRRGLLPEAARLWTATLAGSIEKRDRLDNPLNAAELLKVSVEGIRCIGRAQPSEAVHHASRILSAVPSEHAPAERAAVLAERALGLRERLKLDEAEEDLDNALELLGPDGDATLRSRILAELGQVMGDKGDWAGAALQLESCIRLMSAEQPDVAERLTQLALAYRHIGQSDKALAAITKARQVADGGGDPEQRSIALLGQAEVMAGAKDASAARACVDAVMNIAKAQGDAGAEIRCVLQLAETERLLGNTQHAEEHRKRAIEQASAAGWKQAVLRAVAHAAP